MRTINSPGVQINEIDLSNYALNPVGTAVFAAGFANQGPVDEIINPTTLTEFENIYGIPTNTSEAYFYESCKQVLQSPGNLYCTRLPYGSGSGDGFSQHYSAVLYPASKTQEVFHLATSAITVQSIHILGDEGIEGVDFSAGIESHTLPSVTAIVATVGTNTEFTVESTRPMIGNANVSILSVSSVKVTYTTVYGSEIVKFGAPRTVTLTLDEYKRVENQEFDWDDLKEVPNPTNAQYVSYIDAEGNDYNLMENTGIIVLNTRQTTNDDKGVGYYINIADNTQWGPDNPYQSIRGVRGLSANNTIMRDEHDTETDSQEGVVVIPAERFTRALSSVDGKDSLSQDVENIPKFNFGATYYDDCSLISVIKVSHSNYQPNLLTPVIVESYIGSFDADKKSVADSGGVKRSFYIQDVINTSSSRVKVFVNPAISKDLQWVNPESTSSDPTIKVRVATEAQYLNASGVYQTKVIGVNTKDVGNVASKLEHALRLVENTDTYTLDILIDAGLSTIHTNKDLYGAYNDQKRLPSNLTNFGDTDQPACLSWRAVYNVLDTYASSIRKDCIAIVDPLRQTLLHGTAKQSERKNVSFTDAVYKPLKNLLAAADNSYTAIYANWGLGFNAGLDRPIWLPLSGGIAAVYAKNDSVAQPWFAPAGFTRGKLQGYVDVALNPTQKQRDNLYTMSINPIVFFTGEGLVVYGQKTSQKKPTAFDRVNVRRLFLILERTTQRAVKYFVFEPNTSITRTRLVNQIAPIFDNAKRTQGLYDFMIICDERNNPADAIDRNELIVDIYLKPVKAAEFILINFVATRTGQDFSELI